VKHYIWPKWALWGLIVARETKGIQDQGGIVRDYLRHSNLHVTNKYLQATPESKRLAQGKLVDAILPGGLLSASKSALIQ
jgi:hypothetical protein